MVVVIEVYRDDCGPCKLQKGTILSTLEKYPDVQFRMLEIDRDAELIDEFGGATEVPTVMIFKHTKCVFKSEKVTPSFKIKKVIEECLKV